MVKTRHPHDGTLLAYLEAELVGHHEKDIRAHVEACAACQARLGRLQAQRERISGTLGALAPGPLEQPSARRALAGLQMTINERKGGTMLDRIKNSRRAQRTLAGIAALVIVVGLFALAPVRALARDFLGLFRVERFVVVNVDAERMEQIAEALDENMFFGEEEVLEEPGEPVEVGSLDEAAARAGFQPGKPEGYGEPTSIQVMGASSTRFTPDVEALRAVFETMGLDPALLPEGIDGQPFEISVPAGIMQVYDDGDPDRREDFSIMQVPSPSVEVPEGVDMQALGEAMLQLLGMSPEEAARLSRSIDWTTTLVLPIPVDVATVQEVNVNGTTGLLFDISDYEDIDGGGGALLWQKNGLVTMIAGDGSSIDLLGIAAALE